MKNDVKCRSIKDFFATSLVYDINPEPLRFEMEDIYGMYTKSFSKSLNKRFNIPLMQLCNQYNEASHGLITETLQNLKIIPFGDIMYTRKISIVKCLGIRCHRFETHKAVKLLANKLEGMHNKRLIHGFLLKLGRIPLWSEDGIGQVMVFTYPSLYSELYDDLKEEIDNNKLYVPDNGTAYTLGELNAL